MLKRPDAMIFDLDGTLFKTETLLLPAYHAAFDELRREGTYKGETPDEERILSSLGLLLEQIWRNVLPDEPDEVRKRADELLLHYQLVLLADGVGELYPEVKETLERLHREGVKLFVASNGLEPYVKGVIQAKGLAPLFDGLYSAGEFATRSKNDLVARLLKDHGLQHKEVWMVGDRSSDVEAGKANGLPTIGCHYAGFGKPDELAQADRIIKRFGELAGLVG